MGFEEPLSWICLGMSAGFFLVMFLGEEDE